MKRAFLLVLLLPLATASLVHASPRHEALVRLVPDDVAVCLLLDNLREQGAKLQNSPWLKKIQHTPLGRALVEAPELRKLDAMGEQLAKRLDLPWAKVRDDVFGDALLLAYRPGAPGQPDREAGLLLLHARDGALLEKLIDRYHAELKKTGELKTLEKKQHQGETYVRRVDQNGEQFLYLKDGILALSASEDLLRRALERQAQPKAAALPILQQVNRVGAGKALATLWLNPRAFDGELKQNLQGLPADQARVLQAFLDHWQAVEGLCLTLTVDPEPELALSIHARASALPPTAQRLVKDLATPSDLWQRFPQKSVLTVASRCDFAALNQTLDALLTPEQRYRFTHSLQRPLGLSFGKDVLGNAQPALGPDWGVCITQATDPKQFPHVLLAFRVRQVPGGGPGQFLQEKAALATVQFFVGLAVVDYNVKNKDQVKIRQEMQGKVEVRYLVNDKKFPPGFAPAFAVKDGYLVFGSSPEALRKFTRPSPAPKLSEVPLARLSMPELAKMLAERREPVINFLAQQKHLPPAEAAGLLDRLLGDLSLFERMEVNQRFEEGQVVWVLRLKAGK